ncbi:MAG: bifunctional phosphoserine phosphatase/homoserine phosphotransferase ThrH [SAR324 cluster bacterium]|uniref:phosphoserine phosphatase n=1 Tax=SAR324 cluster bacterium TaxID=2024889 RepID=A0A2A4SSM6_9DELT|nr:MAG: bifunctional phosphoserine phosphatase/homoserine phosphotransferase ThrH [SAR324 cluster bacterium]
MFITCLDLEGVLIPEVWINVAEKTGIEELKLTTRDISDYDVLMKKRLKVIAEHGLTLKYIQEVIGAMDPFPGALEFLDWLRTQSQVVILSDTFVEFAQPFMEKLGMPTILCHNLEMDPQDKIINYKLRIDDPKKRAIQAFRSLNYQTIAAGDSFNDVSMIKEADYGAFFKPPVEIAAQFPQFPVAQDYEAFKTILSGFLKQ